MRHGASQFRLQLLGLIRLPPVSAILDGRACSELRMVSVLALGDSVELGHYACHAVVSLRVSTGLPPHSSHGATASGIESPSLFKMFS